MIHPKVGLPYVSPTYAGCKGRLGYEPSTLQTHHILEKGKGGKDKNSNVILIHKGCHEAIHNI
jgi:hypothetical protein